MVDGYQLENEQEAQLLPGWPTELPHSRRPMQKLWSIHVAMADGLI